LRRRWAYSDQHEIRQRGKAAEMDAGTLFAGKLLEGMASAPDWR
jgi:hypothetical protein